MVSKRCQLRPALISIAWCIASGVLPKEAPMRIGSSCSSNSG
jgi:hypothetical protein